MKINVELFGLEVKHFSTNTITVAQSVWEGRVQTPKTASAFRQVDLHPTIADMLRDFVGDRKEGFLFRTRTGTPSLQSNFLRSSLYPILKELGIEKQGFHGFRRFRVTRLETSCVPPALIKYWTGYARRVTVKQFDRPSLTDTSRWGKTRSFVRTLRSASVLLLNYRSPKRSKLFQMFQVLAKRRLA
jgi:hypothetical protein